MIPKFSELKQSEISSLYHDNSMVYPGRDALRGIFGGVQRESIHPRELPVVLTSL
ncbi:34701_t:CDS:2, partial [Racocetra persica]